MQILSSAQRKKLRGLAHHLEPVVWLGQHGVTEAWLSSVGKALADHELIKVKFNDHKDEKDELLSEIIEKTKAQHAGTIGNIAILYRQHPDREKRKIKL